MLAKVCSAAACPTKRGPSLMGRVAPSDGRGGARAQAAGVRSRVTGIEAYPVEVEVNTGFGDTLLVIVGLPDAAVKESRALGGAVVGSLAFLRSRQSYPVFVRVSVHGSSVVGLEI
jgi:hypothetical protein